MHVVVSHLRALRGCQRSTSSLYPKQNPLVARPQLLAWVGVEIEVEVLRPLVFEMCVFTFILLAVCLLNCSLLLIHNYNKTTHERKLFAETFIIIPSAYYV